MLTGFGEVMEAMDDRPAAARILSKPVSREELAGTLRAEFR